MKIPEFTNWQYMPADPLFNKPSPNLINLMELATKGFQIPWAGNGLVKRNIRGGSSLSSHWFGAAIDTGYYTKVILNSNGTIKNLEQVNDERAHALKFITWLIEHADQFGIQMICDYFGDRVWKNYRDPKVYPTNWKIQNGRGSGYGEMWATYFHIETNLSNLYKDHDYYGLWLEELGRLQDVPAPKPTPPTAEVYLPTLRLGDRNNYVIWAKAIFRKVNYTLTTTNEFDAQMLKVVKLWQGSNGLVVDGILGPKTWLAMSRIPS